MEPLYHPRLKDHEVEYAIKLRQTHDRIKSGILVMAGASTLYQKNPMNDDSNKLPRRKAGEAYQGAPRHRRERDPPASRARLHRHYLEGFEAYKTALNQLGKLLGSAEKHKDQQ